MRAGDFGVVDVVERGLDLETAKGGDEFTFAGDGHTVFLADAECQEECDPAIVEVVGEVF